MLAPLADAGANQVVPRNSTVQLSGFGASRDGTVPKAAWRQTAGPTVTLQNAATFSPSFTAPASAAILKFELVVSNAQLSSVPDTVTIDVRNFAPSILLSLAPQAPRTLQDIVATVNSFDADGDEITLSYAWRRNGSPLAGFTTATLPHTEHAKGNTVEVTVTASDGTESTVRTASVTTVDTPATVTATPPASIDYGGTLSFSAAAVDPDEGDSTELRVSHGPAGMQVSNSGVVSWTAVLPMFGPSLDVNYGLETIGNSGKLTATVRVNDAPRLPPLRRGGIEIPARDGVLQITDLDADGDREILLASSVSVQELAWDGTNYVQQWVYPFGLQSPDGTSVVAANVTGDARQEIFISAGRRLHPPRWTCEDRRRGARRSK